MELVIKCTKCLLVMDESELLRNLPPGVLEKAIRRGKAIKRCERVEQYEKSRAEYETMDIYGNAGDLK